VLAILRAGATPVLADIGEADALLDLESAHRCLTPRTKAVLLVHLYGRVPEMSEWKSFCDEQGLLLLEDCAQAHLAGSNGKFAGTFGACGAFSFYPTKNLGALGDGGALVSDSHDVAEKAKRLRNYGQSTRYHHTDLGLNSRLDELQAAILSARFGWLERFTKRRREIAALYHSRIRNSQIKLLAPPRAEENHVYHLFVVKCRERDRLIEHLENQQIASLVHYPLPIHHQESTRCLGADPTGLRRSENHAATCLSIPCHPQMGDRAVDRVVDALNSFAE
jgi:dTDP-4-amino-4,6-dideoxygalactose transaminase